MIIVKIVDTIYYKFIPHMHAWYLFLSSRAIIHITQSHAVKAEASSLLPCTTGLDTTVK